MKRIAILGCENSHAKEFLTFIRDRSEFSDVEVVGIYSDDPAASEKLSDTFGVPILSHYADAVGKIDGLVITARHGALHAPYANPYIESSIPMFLDKPITIDETEAIELMRALKENGVRVTGGSSLKQDRFVSALRADTEAQFDGQTLGGFVRAPYQSKNKYGDFYFYAPHLVEMVCEIFGRFPQSVTARKNGKQIHVLFHYSDYDCVGVFCDGNHQYFAARMAENSTKAFEIPTTSEWFLREFQEFYGLLEGKEPNISYEELISPVFIMNAIARSLASRHEESVRPIKI